MVCHMADTSTVEKGGVSCCKDAPLWVKREDVAKGQSGPPNLRIPDWVDQGGIHALENSDTPITRSEGLLPTYGEVVVSLRQQLARCPRDYAVAVPCGTVDDTLVH
jgi:hypothetical protein